MAGSSILADTERAQAEASDPSVSAWVSANAGAGKTHVLKLRVLRLLLAGTPPDRILCLTYTKAAAAEMASRVFADLAGWATAGEPDLDGRLRTVLGRPASADERDAARTLFARAIETPGGLKVQTIHAFCERLLQRFPLEAGVAPGFTILEDEECAALRRSATDEVLSRAARDRGSVLGRALETCIAFASGDSFDEILASALARRKWLRNVRRLIVGEAEEIEAFERICRRAFEVRPSITRAAIEAELAGVLPAHTLQRAASALALGAASDRKLAEMLAAARRATSDAHRISCLASAFLTKEGEPRSDKLFVTKAIRAEHAGIYGDLVRARDRFARLAVERQGLVVAEATAALVRIADAVMQGYAAGKARRAALDFDDLVERAASLLASSGAAEWVLYKLDGGLDHILVDEAQDTSPAQWDIIQALAREFFSGSGSRDIARTLFAVGDEKQSIYSFQGAEPAMFAQAGKAFAEAANAAALGWRDVPLTLSFRTVAPLLAAVDRVFADRSRTPGLGAPGEAVKHTALRVGQAGLIEIWDTEKPVEGEASETWSPLGEAPVTSPVTRLAARIADTIRGWLDGKEPLQSQSRLIRPGDILILVRRRRPFAGPMVAALKARGVPVAGADRLRLAEEIVVQDLLALGDFLTLPEDDLALAAVLKSPLFDLDDEDLIRLAPERRGSLWSALLAAAKAEPRCRGAAETLKRWRGLADQIPPFEFLATVLDRDGGRKRLIERLGSEATDPLAELADLALGYDDREAPSLTGFLGWLRAGAREIRRDMEHGRDEVRVLTVHGAKGLEAPIVFLPDTAWARIPPRQGGLVRFDPVGAVAGLDDAFCWPLKGASRLAAIDAGRKAAQGKAAEELDRLLYVAMTRPRDRLYVAGFEGKRGRAQDCWYSVIEQGLEGMLSAVTLADGTSVRRLEARQEAEPETPSHDISGIVRAEPLPEWARRPAPREPQLVLPLAPSRIAPLDVDEEGEPIEAQRKPDATPAEAPSPSPERLALNHRFLRGTITHALFEHLPTLEADRWQAAAQAFVDLRGRVLPARTRASIVSEVLGILRDPGYGEVFGAASRAEVPIAAEIPPPEPGPPPLRLTGQIDRLVVRGDEVVILDYKTNRPPPPDPARVADAYLFQLAAYRLALTRIFPDRNVRAAILWTDGPRLMPIPDAVLVDYERRLWALAQGRAA